jgi:hypothetical protein
MSDSGAAVWGLGGSGVRALQDVAAVPGGDPVEFQRVVDRSHLVREPDESEDALDGGRPADQREVGTVTVREVHRLKDQANPGAVHERHAAQVERQVSVSSQLKIDQRLSDLVAGGNIEVAGRRQDQPRTVAPLGAIEALLVVPPGDDRLGAAVGDHGSTPRRRGPILETDADAHRRWRGPSAAADGDEAGDRSDQA